MLISHTVYPDREYSFNEIIDNILLMNIIYSNNKELNKIEEKPLKVERPLGYFKVLSFQENLLKNIFK